MCMIEKISEDTLELLASMLNRNHVREKEKLKSKT